MKVAIVTESFLPQVNGVANSVRHVARRLSDTGHDVLVIAPGPGPTSYDGVRVVRTRSVALPGYRSFPVGVPGPVVERTLADFAPDVVHLASPIALGAAGARAARRLGIPAVAVYQTDVAGFARQYRISGPRAEGAAAVERLVGGWVRHVHRQCARTLVPSTSSRDQLADLGVGDLHLWRRGVSLDLFDPARASADLRAAWTRGASTPPVLVGYVGRLAAEKKVRRLRELADLPGVQLVVVGDGPERPWLGRNLPGAVFTGMLQGTVLAEAFASLDVFVHLGESETFCQTVQEAQASGVPVVAPARGGPLDLVEHGRTGLLHEPSSPETLVACVSSLTADPDLRATLAAAARRSVARRTWAHLVDELADTHYRAVVADYGGLGPAVPLRSDAPAA